MYLNIMLAANEDSSYVWYIFKSFFSPLTICLIHSKLLWSVYSYYGMLFIQQNHICAPALKPWKFKVRKSFQISGIRAYFNGWSASLEKFWCEVVCDNYIWIYSNKSDVTITHKQPLRIKFWRKKNKFLFLDLKICKQNKILQCMIAFLFFLL